MPTTPDYHRLPPANGLPEIIAASLNGSSNSPNNETVVAPFIAPGHSLSGSPSHSRRRSRSSSRRRHSQRRHRRRSRSRAKIPERNLLGAAFSMIAIVGTCTALAESDWFTFHGGNCRNEKGIYLSSLGVSDFFFPGTFNYSANMDVYMYEVGSAKHLLFNCISPQIVQIMRSILILTLTSCLCMLIAFILDSIGPKQKFIMTVRRNGLPSIIAMFIVVMICGLCYWAAVLLYGIQNENRRAKGSKVQVMFGISYYIIVGTGVTNICATASNLLRRYPPREVEEPSEPNIYDIDYAMLQEELHPTSDPPPYVP